MKRFYKSMILMAGVALVMPVMAQEETTERVVPVKRPLVEEYTGLWCSFCPRGFVALEEMAEEYGEKFIAISYHYNDEMHAKNLAGGFPATVQNYPMGDIDRTGLFDPGYFKDSYPNHLAKPTNADVQVSAVWTNENENEIAVTSTVTFTEDIPNNTYRIAHILVADGLYNDKWLQNNAFAGDWNKDLTGKWWDIFCKGDQYVKGLTFNFVCVYSDATKGQPNSVPQDVKAYEPFTYTSTIQTSKVLSIYNKALVALYGDFAKTRVVSALINQNTGEVVNCNISPYLGSLDNGNEDTTGVNAAVSPEIIKTEYYGLNGLKVSEPRDGLYIKVLTLKDGSRKVSKEILK